MENIKKQYKILRIINWLFALLILFGGMMMLFKATAIGVLIVILFTFFVFSNYAGTAMALNPDENNLIFGFAIRIKKKFLIVSNIILSLLGLAIIISSFATSQYLVSTSGFMYLVPSVLNIIALRSHK